TRPGARPSWIPPKRCGSSRPTGPRNLRRRLPISYPVAMPSWNVGNVTIREAFGCTGDYDAWGAESLVDEWFRDGEGDRVLREICCHLGVSAYGREEQRRAVKRAFRERKLRA